MMVDTQIQRLAVSLNGQFVGELRHENEVTTFNFSEDYIDLPIRPVLGQHFEDGLHKTYRASSTLPIWFSNLLPEGPLRELIANSAGVASNREFFLLGRVGNDLPGAVRVTPFGADDLVDSETSQDGDPSVVVGGHDESELKFSLAGVQLKFSVLETERGLTIPLHGQGGNFIAKLPDSRYPLVPENEWSMMTWARLAGLDVPTAELLSVAQIQGLPIELADVEGQAFVIQRFDREGETRIHIEDFAQVLNRRPTTAGKYGGANYETVLNILLNLGGIEDVREFVRRLVAMVAMGNGDAHLKNVSLIYRDGVRARLSPVYDLVSTSAYIPGDALALNLAGSKQFADVSLESFRRVARRLELSSDKDLDEVVLETVQRLQDVWSKIRSDVPAATSVREGIDLRLRTLPLLAN